MGDPRIAYICGVAWQHELGEPGMRGPACHVYNSISEAVTHGKCSNECGLVEVEIHLKRWVKPQDLFRKGKDARA